MKSLETEFPFLQLVARSGMSVLMGDFVITVDGAVFDTYEIELVIPECGPRCGIPAVRETGGRIPREVNRHVYPQSGFACLLVPDEYWFRYPEGLDLVEFLRGPVRSYFISQTSFESGMGWPFSDRSHGSAGIVEFYSEVLGTSDKVVVRRYLDELVSQTLKPRRLCPCGSGYRIRDCHMSLVESLRSKIPRSVAVASRRYF